jgi:hypothetical protein
LDKGVAFKGKSDTFYLVRSQ